jgi:hypothetical protein
MQAAVCRQQGSYRVRVGIFAPTLGRVAKYGKSVKLRKDVPLYFSNHFPFWESCQLSVPSFKGKGGRGFARMNMDRVMR